MDQDRFEQYVNLFKTLADETRLKIVVLLLQRELCVCQIEAALGISQTKASRHLALLRHVGLLKSRRDGLWIYYTLKEPLNKVEGTLFKTLKEAFCIELSAMEDLANKQTCTIQPLTSKSESNDSKRST